MGVPGLWSELGAAATERTLAGLAWEKFERDRCELRLGVDASLWLFHVRKARGGANPELRTLFFRLARLLTLPVAPVFVFDGPQRPRYKRAAVVETARFVTQERFRSLLDAFGYVHWTAPGEAEAELAWLGAEGHLDALLTDDVDAFLFGAPTVVRNWGEMLTGNVARRAAHQDQAHEAASEPVLDEGRAGSPEKLDAQSADPPVETVAVFSSERMPLDRDGMILVALLAGADYDVQGLVRCGVKTAMGLAKAGLGTELLDGFRTLAPEPGAGDKLRRWSTFLSAWRERVRAELATNATGHLSRRMPKLAAELDKELLGTDDALQVLRNHASPITSQRDAAKRERLLAALAARSRPQLDALADHCSRLLGWSSATVQQRFARLVFPGMVVQELLAGVRCAEDPPANDASTPRRNAPPAQTTPPRRAPSSWTTPRASRITDFFAGASLGTPSTPERDMRSRVRAVHATRRHASAEHMLEARISYSTDDWAAVLAPGDERAADGERHTAGEQRLWTAACLLEAQRPPVRHLVAAYQQRSPSKRSPAKRGAKELGVGQMPLTAFFTGAKNSELKHGAPPKNAPPAQSPAAKSARSPAQSPGKRPAPSPRPEAAPSPRPEAADPHRPLGHAPHPASSSPEDADSSVELVGVHLAQRAEPHWLRGPVVVLDDDT